MQAKLCSNLAVLTGYQCADCIKDGRRHSIYRCRAEPPVRFHLLTFVPRCVNLFVKPIFSHAEPTVDNCIVCLLHNNIEKLNIFLYIKKLVNT